MTVDVDTRVDLVNEQLVTVPQVAKHFGISRAKAWRMILKGRWPSVKIDGSRRTSLEAIARVIERDQVPSC